MATCESPVLELVLLGDIIEYWMIPYTHNMIPPEQIATNNAACGYNFDIVGFTSLIRQIAQNGTGVVFVLKGNHETWASRGKTKQGRSTM